MKSFSKYSDESLDFTPLIDIIFILLIFVLLTFRYQQKDQSLSELVLRLPQAQGQALQKKKSIRVLVPWQKQARINGQVIDEDNFQSFHRQIKPLLAQWANKDQQQRVQIFADKRISLQRLGRILSFLQRCGVRDSSIIMVTNQRSQGK